MHYHVTDWTFSTPIAPVVDPAGETVEYLSYAMCSDGRVLCCWVTSISGNVRSRVKIGYAADVDTFVNTPGSITSGTTIFQSTNNSGGGMGVAHGAVSAAPNGGLWLTLTVTSMNIGATWDASVTLENLYDAYEPGDIPMFMILWSRDDGATWDLVQSTRAGPFTGEGGYPLMNSTTGNGVVLAGAEDRMGLVEVHDGDPRWGDYMAIVKGNWFGNSGSAIYMTPTYFVELQPRTSPASAEWGLTRLVGVYPDRRADNGFAQVNGSMIVDTSTTNPSGQNYGFLFHTQAPQIVGRVSHGLWMQGRNPGNATSAHPIDIHYGASYEVSPSAMKYTVNAISNVGNLAGVSATFTSGDILNAVNCQPRYGRILRHAPGGVRTMSIFCVDVDPDENLPGQSMLMSPWTSGDEVVGVDVYVPPPGWVTKAEITGWTATTGRQRLEAFAAPLCNYLVVASADEISYMQIRTCFPPRRLHIPHKHWRRTFRRDEQLGLIHAAQNWRVITNWCNVVWLERQRFVTGCPPPLDYVETGPFHPPYPEPVEDWQFEMNYIDLEQWARNANVCWSGGLHVQNKKVLEREDHNLLTVERWANLPPVGSKVSTDCLP